MATSLLPAFALGPVSLLGQALVKFHLATAVPCWLYMVIEPFLRAESMSPCSTSLRHFHMSMASVMPRLSVMLFHFRRPGTFTLKRGITDAMDMWKWRKLVEQGDIDSARKNGSITMYNQQGTAVAKWNFTNAWPSKLTGPSANAGNNEVAIEELELTHEGYERVS